MSATLQPFVDQINSMIATINEIDAQLEASSGKTNRRTVNKEAIESVGDQTDFLEKLVARLVQETDESAQQILGMKLALDQLFDAKFEATVEKHAEARLAELNANVDPEATKVSDDERARLLTERKEAHDKVVVLHNALPAFGPEGAELASGIVVPKKKSAGGGKSGPRLKGFQWSVNGTLSGKTLTEVAAGIKGVTAGALKTAILEQNEGLDFKNPPARVEFTVRPGDNTYEIVGNRVAVAVDDADDAEDDDDDYNDEG